MLWLGLYFPDLPLELLQRAQPSAVVLAVSQRQQGREVIARCNSAAAVSGVRPGMPLQAALALHEALQIQPRNRQAEQQALQDLALWAYQFSPQICFEPSLLLLEVGASLRLFGGLTKLLKQLRREAEGLGFRAQLACAATPMAAALLARNRPERCLDTCVAQPDLQTRLADLPLASLTRDREARRLLTDIGLRTLGECWQLPREALARRVGQHLLLLLDRLLGSAADPRAYWQPPERFSQKIELLGEICQHTGVLFPARRLIVALCGFLRGRAAAAQYLHWSLLHREAPATCFTQGLLSPSRDPDYMLEMLRERIERVSLPEPVIAVMLQVRDCVPFAELSSELLAERLPRPEQHLLERLRNRLGEQQVQGLCLLPDHRPERAWDYCVPGAPISEVVQQTLDVRGLQPPWLLHQPRPLDQRQGVPHYAGPLQLCSRPRRIESGWWDGFDVARDYFVALSRAGERLWVFRDRRSGRWFLHGLFS